MIAKTSKVRQAGISGCAMVGFFGIFAIAGAVAFYFMTFRPIANILAARSWAATECVIVSSRVAENRSSDGSTYRVEITYTYEADWQTHQGDRYDFSVGSSSGHAAKAKVVEAHPPGSEVTCYVDPDDPTRSVINRAPGGYLGWGLFPLPFLAVGVGGLVFFLVASRGKARAQRGGGSMHRGSGPRGSAGFRGGKRARASSAFAAPGVAVSHGPLELEAGQTPTAKLIAVIVFSTLWNGVVSLFVFFSILPSFERGHPEWLMTIFMVPFVLIGLATMGGVVYQLLAMFNPRPRLTLASGHLTPGAEITLCWEIIGQAGRLRDLTIELEGREAATYRSGKNTRTERHVFHSARVVASGSSDGPSSITKSRGVQQSGQATLYIPEATMPSFEARHNKIEWRLKVHGDIPLWPDVNQDFPVTIAHG